MAGDWIKLQHTTPDKPEVVTMAARLGIDQDAVVGKLIRIWIWADQNSLNGNALTVTDAFLDRVTAHSGFSGALREVGWLSGRQGLLTIPNFDRHNGQTAKARAATNSRVARHRSKSEGNKPTVTTVTQPTLPPPLPEKRREEIKDRAPSATRARNELLDALVEACGRNPTETTKPAWQEAATALAAIKEVCPAVTRAELLARAAVYVRKHRDWELTPSSLAKWWDDCATKKPAAPPATMAEPAGWRERFADYVHAATPWPQIDHTSQAFICEQMKRTA